MTTPQVKKPLAYFIGENPLRAIEWPIWTVLFLAGVYLLTPFYDPTMAPNTNGGIIAAVASETALKIYGGFVALVGALGLGGLAFNKPALRSWAAHIGFFVFLYVTILRIGFVGFDNVGWITYFVNTLVCAAMILRIKWEALHRGTTN